MVLRCAHIRSVLILLGFVGLVACSTSAPKRSAGPGPKHGGLFLPDRVAYMQTDPRWSKYTLGGSGERLSSTGCLVTAVAMALRNLGFQTDPGDLSRKLKAYGGFNRRGWLVWSGVERATAGRARAYYYRHGDAGTVRACLRRGAYPLVKFTLPNGSPHWALVLGENKSDFYVRDPTVKSRNPIALSTRTKHIEAVRCIGMNRGTPSQA